MHRLGERGHRTKQRGDWEPKHLSLEQWLGLVLQLTVSWGMLSIGTIRKHLKAKLSTYLFIRKFGKKEWGNLIHHILSAKELGVQVLVVLEDLGGLFPNFHTKMTLYSEMLTPDFHPLKRCKGNGNLNE